MDKVSYFKKEISYIKSEDVRSSLVTMINLLPDYFFEIPASSTLKYHPNYALTESGLVKHTKVVVRIGIELLDNAVTGGSFTAREKDLIIMALVLHDGLKCGNPREKYTAFMHPMLMSEYIMKNKDALSIGIDDVRVVCNIIESHMGQWNVNPYKDNEVLPIPRNKLARFVHMCDYLASRKFIEVEFDGIDIKY